MLAVVLFFLIVFISFSDQPEDVVISPTIDKVMVDGEVVFDSGIHSSNMVTGNVLAGKLFKKGSTVALFKGESRVILSSVEPGDLNRMYFRDVERDAIDVDGDVRDLVWIENAPCGGQVHAIDMEFYHRGIPCVVLVDLKIGGFKSEYIGQMNKYLNWYKEHKKYEWEKDPVGLIICQNKGKEEVYYALGE